MEEILDRLQKQIYFMCGIAGTPFEKQCQSALRELQKYEDKKYKEKLDDYFKCKYQCEWIGLEDDTKWSKNTRIDKSNLEELFMEERLKELKEKITTFVRDYDIESFNVWIDETDSTILKNNKNVNLEIRV